MTDDGTMMTLAAVGLLFGVSWAASEVQPQGSRGVTSMTKVELIEAILQASGLRPRSRAWRLNEIRLSHQKVPVLRDVYRSVKKAA